MMEKFGMTSLNSPRLHLRALQKKGWIEIRPKESRAIRIVFKPEG